MPDAQGQLRLHKPLKSSLKEYARGIAGGLLFSFPLLFTMEVWWAGFSVTPGQLMLLLLATYVLLLGYNRFAGMRPGSSWRSVFIDSVEEMGLGLVLAFLVLLMLNRIQLHGMELLEIMGKTVIEGMAVAIGVSVGTAQLGAQSDEDEQEADELQIEQWSGKLKMAVLALCGAFIIGSNVAPTEEVLIIAYSTTPLQLLVMVLVSLLLTIVIVYFSDFTGTNSKRSRHFMYELTFDTCLSYLVALGGSGFILWFFGRFDGESFWGIFSQCIVLGLLASLGASAARLLIK
ncbi:TIGR02587 family membrane protein [Pontibacter arcticus]|uniref:TIGR02587 family membrane protein n=1 Tax=Pontibacter arcticus TaxID=2080288 RepID=A0A364REL1_9BACT|nr:TIGR02587 family membrane protein [Pontibacter arcticus]RAU82712.1 TIGR02587 family membrane protein [Pontibacter arcticus]